MKIATRKRLAEMMVEALDDPDAAIALRRLARACETSSLDNAAEHLLKSVSEEERLSVVSRLRAFGMVLTEWSGSAKDEEETPRARALRKGVLLFNHRLFFEVHEVLEAQWMRESGVEKTFLQGLIQIAVAFHHLENGNLRGTLALLHDGLEKIAPRQPEFLGVELVEFVRAIRVCRGELLKLGEARVEEFCWQDVPQLRMCAAC